MAAPETPAQLSHVDATGAARMVDVSDKDDTAREGVAEGFVVMEAATLALILEGGIAKGDVLAVARVAGIMGAKQTSNIIPMCHPLAITGREDGPRKGRRRTAPYRSSRQDHGQNRC